MFFLQSKGGLKMPKREDINTVLVIGSGPIIIGQACEFDYSGTQACKALRGLGYKIVLVNSNPATIMTDPETADVTYIEPLNVERLTQIIEKERPDALLPNLGGQSALNLCSELSNAGVLDEYNVQVLGVKVDAIERGEDRLEFKKAMNELGIEMARSEIANTVDEALAIADKLGYPVVVPRAADAAALYHGAGRRVHARGHQGGIAMIHERPGVWSAFGAQGTTELTDRRLAAVIAPADAAEGVQLVHSAAEAVSLYGGNALLTRMLKLCLANCGDPVYIRNSMDM